MNAGLIVGFRASTQPTPNCTRRYFRGAKDDKLGERKATITQRQTDRLVKAIVRQVERSAWMA